MILLKIVPENGSNLKDSINKETFRIIRKIPGTHSCKKSKKTPLDTGIFLNSTFTAFVP